MTGKMHRALEFGGIEHNENKIISFTITNFPLDHHQTTIKIKLQRFKDNMIACILYNPESGNDVFSPGQGRNKPILVNSDVS